MMVGSGWRYPVPSPPGDFNGDTRPNILIGAPGCNVGGSAYVVFGPVSGTASLAAANAILHGDRDDEAGDEVAAVGDMDGDGLDDRLIAGPNDDEGGEGAGAAWLVLGGSLTFR
ncbi:MAG: hypothetical protein Q8P18_07720 [Pseudomonadota bacterium]|nr:hypothetical protein [Pseudomonadota bacterium]